MKSKIQKDFLQILQPFPIKRKKKRFLFFPAALNHWEIIEHLDESHEIDVGAQLLLGQNVYMTLH